MWWGSWGCAFCKHIKYIFYTQIEIQKTNMFVWEGGCRKLSCLRCWRLLTNMRFNNHGQILLFRHVCTFRCQQHSLNQNVKKRCYLWLHTWSTNSNKHFVNACWWQTLSMRTLISAEMPVSEGKFWLVSLMTRGHWAEFKGLLFILSQRNIVSCSELMESIDHKSFKGRESWLGCLSD